MTEGLTIAFVAAAPPTIAAVLTWLSMRKRSQEIGSKVDEVHAMANDRLTKALDKIEELRLVVERQRVTIEENRGDDA